MKMEKITVGNEVNLIENALEKAGEFVALAGIEGKAAIHVNLLVEEVLGMVRAMVEDFSAKFWMETEEGECRIYIDAIADVNRKKRKDLLSVSKSGKNVAKRGLMAKIGEFFEDCFGEYQELEEMGVMDLSYMYTAGISGNTSVNMGYTTWSLSRYRTTISEDAPTKEDAKEAWDELEKSIVANIADDVIVGIKDDRITLTVIKKI